MLKIGVCNRIVNKRNRSVWAISLSGPLVAQGVMSGMTSGVHENYPEIMILSSHYGS